MAKDLARWTLCIHVGIINFRGEVLIKRRVGKRSYRGSWELPGGTLKQEPILSPLSHLPTVLIRKVLKQTGINIGPDMPITPAIFPVASRGPRGFKLTGVTPVILDDAPVILDDAPAINEELCQWVSLEKVDALAAEFNPINRSDTSQGLFLGTDGFMHHLIRYCFASTSHKNLTQAQEATRALCKAVKR